MVGRVKVYLFFSIGTALFNNGFGDVTTYPEALQWFQRAAAQGHIRAFFYVAYLLQYGPFRRGPSHSLV